MFSLCDATAKQICSFSGGYTAFRSRFATVCGRYALIQVSSSPPPRLWLLIPPLCTLPPPKKPCKFAAKSFKSDTKKLEISQHILRTRMHSSRMRTGRSLTVCRSLLPGGGVSAPVGVCSGGGLLLGGCPLPGGSALGGCLLLGDLLWVCVCLSAPWGVCSWGGLLPGEGVSALGEGGCLLGGVCLLQGGGIPACTAVDTPCEQNDKQVQKYYLGHNFVAAGNKLVSDLCYIAERSTTHSREKWIGGFSM